MGRGYLEDIETFKGRRADLEKGILFLPAKKGGTGRRKDGRYLMTSQNFTKVSDKLEMV